MQWTNPFGVVCSSFFFINSKDSTLCSLYRNITIILHLTVLGLNLFDSNVQHLFYSAL